MGYRLTSFIYTVSKIFYEILLHIICTKERKRVFLYKIRRFQFVNVKVSGLRSHGSRTIHEPFTNVLLTFPPSFLLWGIYHVRKFWRNFTGPRSMWGMWSTKVYLTLFLCPSSTPSLILEIWTIRLTSCTESWLRDYSIVRHWMGPLWPRGHVWEYPVDTPINEWQTESNDSVLSSLTVFTQVFPLTGRWPFGLDGLSLVLSSKEGYNEWLTNMVEMSVPFLIRFLPLTVSQAYLWTPVPYIKEYKGRCKGSQEKRE